MADAIPHPAADDASVRSVRRALAILRAFGPDDTGLPLGEIARRADLDKATARRLLRTLIAEGLMRQHAPSKDYSLDLGVLELAAGATPADTLRRLAGPRLAGIVAASGCAALLLVAHEDAALCLATLDGEPPCRAPRQTGERIALHTDAAARVLMAYLRLEERMALLAGALPAPPCAGAGAPPTDPFQLSARLDTIRQRDWDVATGEVAPGIAVLGAPVRGLRGAVVAALALAGPHEMLLTGEEPRFLDLLRGEARAMERALAAPAGRGLRRPAATG